MKNKLKRNHGFSSLQKQHKSTKKPVPVGRTVMVRNGHINKNAKEPNGRRTHVVIETNKDNLALVRLTSKKPGTTQLVGYKRGNSYFKNFVEVEDVHGNPLRVGSDVTQNHKNLDVPIQSVQFIRQTIEKSAQKDLYRARMNKFRKL